MNAHTSVVALTAEITGDVSAQEMLADQETRDRAFTRPGIDAGGRVVLGTATTVDVTVKDANGKVLVDGVTYTSDTDIDASANGVKGPLKVTTANISDPAHTLAVHWYVKL